MMGEFKIGDRVRVTLEGVYEDYRRLLIDGWELTSYLDKRATDQDTFQIERIEPPLKVGDRVVSKEDEDRGIIRAIHENEVWVFWEKDQFHTTTYLSEVERIA